MLFHQQIFAKNINVKSIKFVKFIYLNKLFIKLLLPIILILSINFLYLKQNCTTNPKIIRIKFWYNLLSYTLSQVRYNNIDKSLWKIYAFKESRKKHNRKSWFDNQFFFFTSNFHTFRKIASRKFFDALKRYNISSRDRDTEKSLSTRVTLANSLSMLNTAEKISRVEIGRKRESLLVAWINILTNI